MALTVPRRPLPLLVIAAFAAFSRMCAASFPAGLAGREPRTGRR